MITRVRGTEDFLDLKLQNFVIETIKKQLICYNFKQIETPVLEPTNLFVRSLGKETDVVSKEMYIFETSSGESICLRPEATAPIMRAFLEGGMISTPWKVFSYGPMFRHERPQKGRWRQFLQLTIEVIGSSAIEEDAHCLKMLDRLFGEVFNLENYVLKLNFLGTLEDRKAHQEKLYAFLTSKEKEICDTCKTRKEKNILRIFDCKNEDCKKTYVGAPKVTDTLSETSKKEWKQLKDLLNILSVSYVEDPTLVRGLDYYNKTVFEFTSDELGAQNAFCGGGRYDSLAMQLGAKEDYPSLGAAIGIGRLLMLLKPNSLSIPEEVAINVIIPMNVAQKPLALLLANELHHNGICTDILLEDGSMKSLMRKANKMGAKNVLILGEQEQQDNTVSVKNMQSGESVVVRQSEVAKKLT